MAANRCSATPLGERRAALEKLVAAEGEPALMLSPATADRALAADWLERSGGALDGVIAKRLDGPYRPGERAMIKVKVRRTADCVIGGFRYEQKGGGVASLLLGLYDEAGLLNHVGYTSSIAASERADWAAMLEPLIEAPGFTGKAPGGPSRWSNERSSEWQPLKPEIGGRSALRPGHRPALPPWHQAAAQAPRQGAAPVHDGAAKPSADPGRSRATASAEQGVGGERQKLLELVGGDHFAEQPDARTMLGTS